ncbi:hypothetical protein [Hyalangium sp.]|uniref:hypothetical protein n=1 Tax=Hyalangium sp. TaxID=2028555 RepID=UPI002D6F8FE1|nr:hypothetical protein [Hyalangium sp.]HYH94596.1 hypothetical protein [Hyalangium sp.]
MDTSRIEQLGLRLEQGPTGTLATLELAQDAALTNPVTRQSISTITFQLEHDRLIPAAPPAVVGLTPVILGAVATREDISLLLTGSFDDYLFHIERRSAQLHTMGLHPDLDPETLVLSTELEAGPLALTLVADRHGQFQVGQVRRDGQALGGLPPFRFELFDFRDQASLATYLSALIEERLARPPSAAVGPGGRVRYEEIAQAFGSQALVPPRSPLEVLVHVRVNGENYRFAAGRVMGRTFRGLLAGAKGKVWSDRFELDGFPGIVQLVAGLLKVPSEAVQIVGPDSPQE